MIQPKRNSFGTESNLTQFVPSFKSIDDTLSTRDEIKSQLQDVDTPDTEEDSVSHLKTLGKHQQRYLTNFKSMQHRIPSPIPGSPSNISTGSRSLCNSSVSSRNSNVLNTIEEDLETRQSPNQYSLNRTDLNSAQTEESIANDTEQERLYHIRLCNQQVLDQANEIQYDIA